MFRTNAVYNIADVSGTVQTRNLFAKKGKSLVSCLVGFKGITAIHKLKYIYKRFAYDVPPISFNGITASEDKTNASRDYFIQQSTSDNPNENSPDVEYADFKTLILCVHTLLCIITKHHHTIHVSTFLKPSIDLEKRKKKAVGIRDNLAVWFEKYLQNRKEAVVIKVEKSEYTTIPSEVLQGSVLGPFLFPFLYYISDLSGFSSFAM